MFQMVNLSITLARQRQQNRWHPVSNYTWQNGQAKTRSHFCFNDIASRSYAAAFEISSFWLWNLDWRILFTSFYYLRNDTFIVCDTLKKNVREISVQGKWMVPHVQSLIYCEIGCFVPEFFFQFTNSQFYSWLTTAQAICSEAPKCKPVQISDRWL